MKTIIKVIGSNRHNESGSSVSSPSPGLVDEANNKISTKITEIISGDRFTIYCEKGYKNIWTAGYNKHGECAAKYI